MDTFLMNKQPIRNINKPIEPNDIQLITPANTLKVGEFINILAFVLKL